MEYMSEHTDLISSLSLLLVQTQAARWKAATLEQLIGAHLYLDIAKSGYPFHGYPGGMTIIDFSENLRVSSNPKALNANISSIA